jgi:hypothetical protein
MLPDNSIPLDRNRPLQLVYRRQVRRCETEAPVDADVNLQLFTGPARAIAHFLPLIQAWGWLGWLKAIAKLVTPSRNLYAVFMDGKCVSFGWIMLGHCRAYRIEPTACVIGPIFTSGHLRGRGLAPLGIRYAVRKMFRRGWKTYYMDTSCDNVASQRAIIKAGFSGPIAAVPSQ